MSIIIRYFRVSFLSYKQVFRRTDDFCRQKNKIELLENAHCIFYTGHFAFLCTCTGTCTSKQQHKNNNKTQNKTQKHFIKALKNTPMLTANADGCFITFLHKFNSNCKELQTVSYRFQNSKYIYHVAGPEPKLEVMALVQ